MLGGCLDNRSKQERMASIAAQVSQVQCHAQGLSRMSLEHTEQQGERKRADCTGATQGWTEQR